MNKKWMWIIWGVIGVLIIVSLTSTSNSHTNPPKKVITYNDTIVDTLVVDTMEVDTMNYYEEAIEHLKHYEGFRSRVYIDVDGSRTIGYGHHLLSGETYQNISEGTATDILKRDFDSRFSVITAKYDVNYTQALSLTLFSFNLGLGGLQRAVSSGMLEDIDKITQYCHYSTYVNGIRQVHKSKKLLERRNYELSLYLIN